MERLQNRRRFLQLATAGTAASVAGCSSLQSSTDDSNGSLESPDGDELDVSDTALTALVQPDQEALVELQAELDQEIESGELDQMEAQQEFQRRQLELVRELGEAFEEDAESIEGLSVEESMAEQGAFLVDGDADALVAELNDGDLSALLPGQEFVDALEQAQAQPAEGDLDEEALEEVDEE